MFYVFLLEYSNVWILGLEFRAFGAFNTTLEINIRFLF